MTTAVLRHGYADLVRKGFFYLFSVNVLIQLLAFGNRILIAAFVTPEELGQIGVLQSYILILTVLAGFGYNSAVLKLCAEKRPDEEKRFLLHTALRRSLVATLLVYLGTALLVLTGLLVRSDHLGFWLLVFALVLPFSVPTAVLMAYVQANKQIKELARLQGGVKVQGVVLIVAGAWAFGFEGFILASILAYAVGLIPFIRSTKVAFGKTASYPLPPEFTRFAFFSMLANAVTLLGQYSDFFVLGNFAADAESVGYYTLAATFALAGAQVTATVQAIATPYFSERDSDHLWLRRKLWRTQAKMVGMSVVAAAGVFIGAYGVIKWMLGMDWLPAMNYLAILLLRYILWSSYAILGAAVMAIGMVRYNFYVGLLTTPVAFFLSYVFLLRYGIPGVAWAQVLVTGFTALVMGAMVLWVLRANRGPVDAG